MNKFLYKAMAPTITALIFLGCASTPQVAKGSSDFLKAGMASAKIKGNEFYMAIGEVDLYKYGLFGNLKPSGKSVEIAVVIQADKDTGEVLKIATMQTNSERSDNGANYENGVAVVNGSPYAISDLRGGISVIDLQSYPRWLDAIDAMRDAIAKLGTYANFAVTDRDQLAPVVAIDMGIGWYNGFDWGPGWGRGHGFRRRR